MQSALGQAFSCRRQTTGPHAKNASTSGVARFASAPENAEILRKGGARSPAAACAVMSRADAILRHRDDVLRLAAMYHDVFESLPRPDPTRHGRASGYYRIGAKYDELCGAQRRG